LFGGPQGAGKGKSGDGRGSGLGGLVGGPGQGRGGSGRGTKTRYFVEDQGNSFVFVIDRSLSMDQSGRLAAAKAELRSALKNLNSTNQFHIIFYNDKPAIFRPIGGRAFTADEPTKVLAERFIGSITADGPTDGFERALRMAVSFHPDVIYFLTDAEDISLSDADLASLSRTSYGTTIHAIKFGEGAEERIPWMVKLAGQNGGQYVYVDSRRFSQRR
jgi:Ca-activated chloride channel family protein